jgi:hypothetical protein
MNNFREEVVKMKNEVKIAQEEQKSFAMQFVDTLKVQNKRLFICWIITFLAFIALLGYTIWLLNDVETITTEVTQDSETGYNNFIGNDGDIINGTSKN